MTFTRIATVAVSTFTMLTIATTATPIFAQTATTSSSQASAVEPGATYRESTTRDGRGVIFDDDLGTGASPGGGSSMFVPTHSASRALLLRPRFQFISEMLKTIENF